MGSVGDSKTDQRKPRFLCLHGFRTSGEILKKQIFDKWPIEVVNSLKKKEDRGGNGDHRRPRNGQGRGNYMHAQPASCRAAYGPPIPSFETPSNNAHENIQPSFVHSAQDAGRYPRSSGSNDHSSKSRPYHETHSRDYRGHGHHTYKMQQNGAHSHSSYVSHPQHVGQIPVPPTTIFHQQSGNDVSMSYEPRGAESNTNRVVEGPLGTKMVQDIINHILQEISSQLLGGEEIEGHLQGIVGRESF